MSEQNHCYVTFRLPKAMRRKLERAAKARHHTLSSFIRSVLDASLRTKPAKK